MTEMGMKTKYTFDSLEVLRAYGCQSLWSQKSESTALSASETKELINDLPKDGKLKQFG